MGLSLEIAHFLLPTVIVVGIAVFVVISMNHKYKQGTLGKKTKELKIY